MSLEFLAPDAAFADRGYEPLARSPMERDARAAGARFEARDGWSVAAAYTSTEQERKGWRTAVGWADTSHLGKIEIQASADDLAAIVERCTGRQSLGLGRGTRAAEAWWCPLTREKALMMCAPAVLAGLRDRIEEAATAAGGFTGVVEVSTAWAALTVVGPQARETLARFCALDLRPAAMPLGAFRPGSVARTPGAVLREDEDRFLMVFGWALGQYMWTVVADAARHLGGTPVGVDALDAIEQVAAEVEEAPRA